MRGGPPATTGTSVRCSIEVLLSPEQHRAALRADAAAGLKAARKQLSPTWFYDERGCELFERITRLPEYYPTRTERGILAAHAGDIAAAAGADTLVELGSGTSEKTRLVLDAMAAAGRLDRIVPFDVAEPTLRAAAAELAHRYPGSEVHAVVGDFRDDIGRLPREGRRMVAFLGGTIGNLRRHERAALLRALGGNLAPGESLLLGTDLVKDPVRLVAAYDDADGVTAEFNRNVLRVLNRELGAGFDPDRFRHVARYDHDREWIEMRLRSIGSQTVEVADLGLTVAFDDGEDLLTEISAKFRREGIAAELLAAGFEPTRWYSDEAGDFGLTLAVRATS